LRLRWRFLFRWGDFWRATIAQKSTAIDNDNNQQDGTNCHPEPPVNLHVRNLDDVLEDRLTGTGSRTLTCLKSRRSSQKSLLMLGHPFAGRAVRLDALVNCRQNPILSDISASPE